MKKIDKTHKRENKKKDVVLKKVVRVKDSLLYRHIAVTWSLLLIAWVILGAVAAGAGFFVFFTVDRTIRDMQNSGAVMENITTEALEEDFNACVVIYEDRLQKYETLLESKGATTTPAVNEEQVVTGEGVAGGVEEVTSTPAVFENEQPAELLP